MEQRSHLPHPSPPLLPCPPRVPALNTNAAFIGDLADAVLEALPYVGAMASPSPSGGLVPIGDLDTLLDAYDR